MYRKFFKRFFDVVLSACALIVLSPVLLAVAVLVRLKLGSPVIFHQERLGKDEKTFRLYKFRSMTDERDEEGNLLPDEARLTKFGRLLRSTSLDELPELWNILKGDMSLVGTRPPTADEFEKYNQYYRRRISMTPGLTGLWQVSGRSDIEDFDDVVKYDLEYIDGWSLTLDMKILLRTIWVVLAGRGSR